VVENLVENLIENLSKNVMSKFCPFSARGHLNLCYCEFLTCNDVADGHVGPLSTKESH
jgi:hypothetical protein